MKTFRNILVVHNSMIGDVVMSSAAFKLLRELYQDAKITLLTSPVCSEILFDKETINKVIPDKVPKGTFSRQLYKLKLFMHCLKARYDICFFFDHSKLSVIKLFKYAGIPVIVTPWCGLSGEKSQSMHRYSTHAIPLHAAIEMHNVDYYQDIVQGFDCRGTRHFPYIAVDNSPFPYEREISAHKKKVALCFRGRGSNLNRWPMEYFKEVTEHLLGKGYFLYALVAPSECEPLRDTLKKYGMDVAVYGTENLASCAGYLRQADLLVSVNTGQTHLAAALGIPVISLTGRDGPATYPYSPKGVALSAVHHCGDCTYSGECDNVKGKRNPEFVPKCILKLTPKSVMPYIDDMLKGKMPKERFIILT